MLRVNNRMRRSACLTLPLTISSTTSATWSSVRVKLRQLTKMSTVQNGYGGKFTGYVDALISGYLR